jgi:hypothetical protein
LKKYVGEHRAVVVCSFLQFVSFAIFVSLDVLYCESFEIILHFSNKTQILLDGGFLGDALFFYFSSDHFRNGAEDAILNPDGS